MPTITQLQKQAREAKQYVLHIEGAGFLASNEFQHMTTGVVFTEHLELAEKYAVGYDNAEMKLSYWNARLKTIFPPCIKFMALSAEEFTQH